MGSDLFPAAGIKFWDCAHEYNAGMMADGYSRVTGKMSMMIAQNGPGITNFVTPVCCNYQHNDAFPGSHPLYAGPLGYNGSKAAMELIAQADVVLALGTRLNPFSTLPGYGINYWPAEAKLIQVDINEARIGLTKPVTVGIQGDACLVAEGILEQLSPSAGD